MLTDGQCAIVEQCRARAKTLLRILRWAFEAILCCRQNGVMWRSVPTKLSPWWFAAPTFIRWARLGIWGCLLFLVHERGIYLDIPVLDGTSVRAHQTAAGAR